jgi:uroporphyrinogen-III synthase
MASGSMPELTGTTVLITRPEHQAHKLCAMLEAAGGTPVCFPALEILPSEKIREAAELLGELDRFDWLIFISANAVRYAAELLARQPLPEPVRVAAIGQATTAALAAAGIRIDLVPSERFNSEALLSMPEMRNLDRQKIVIVRGEGGREVLRDALRARGAEVRYAEVYRRALPTADTSALLSCWRRGGIGIVTVTSGEALENLARLLGENGIDLLRTTPLIIISPRLEQQAHRLGCRRVIVARAPTDEAVLEAVHRIAQKK